MASYWDDEDRDDEPEMPIPRPNQIAIGGQDLPGLCLLPKGKLARKLDKKNGPGREGATQTWQGYEPPEIKLTLRMWRASHRKEWDRIRPEIMPKLGKAPKNAFTVQNLVLNGHGIGLILIEEVGLPEEGKTYGEVTVEIVVSQYLAASSKSGVVTPKASATTPPTVHDLKGGHAPAGIGPPAAPRPPSDFNANP